MPRRKMASRRADDGEGNRHHHGDRQRPALVLRGEDQEHEDQPEHECDRPRSIPELNLLRASPAHSKP